MINNSWIYSQRLGDVFITHDNIGWVVGKDLKNHCVALTKQDMEKPKTSLLRKPLKSRNRKTTNGTTPELSNSSLE